jgi:hypothetical protein
MVDHFHQFVHHKITIMDSNGNGSSTQHCKDRTLSAYNFGNDAPSTKSLIDISRRALLVTKTMASNDNIPASCCCGAVKFELKAEPSMMGTCHCSRCRKVGASTIAFVKKSDLVWIQGKDNISLYQPPPPYKYGRCFCKTCGSSLGEILSEEDSFPIAANTLDADIKLPNQFHEFTKEVPSWYKIGDNAKQYEGHPV